MTRLFINSDLLSILGEFNIYYINHKYILLYLGLANTTFNKQNFYINKKNHTLIFWSGNSGNSGNNADQALKIQQRKIPTFIVFDSHYSHFSFWQQKLDTLFFNDFLEKPKYYRNAYFLCIFTLISVVINKLRQYHRNDDLDLITLSCIKPPNTQILFSKIFSFLVYRREFLRWI